MKLLIAIPALNEEDSVANIIERSLAARDFITANSNISKVEITLVSDGSTDRTVEIAQQYIDKINLIVFEKNRGYGAAIKEAWNRSDADLLGFLDADGTCDPKFFAPLCQAIANEHADIAIGNRMHSDSKMPFIRRMGNFLFALVLTFFSSKQVHDTASGMRVLQRASLPKIFPLPDGLHFTPAMSARAILSGNLKLIEINMPYHERAGESKLKIWKDGLRFFKIISETALLYKPSRLLNFIGLICLVLAIWFMIFPTIHYFQKRVVEEWMIYRFVVSNLLGTSACLLFCIGYLTRKTVALTLSYQQNELKKDIFGRFFTISFFWIIPFLLFFTGGILVIPSFFELIKFGATYEHWSRFIAMSFLYSIAIILIVTKVIDYCLGLISDRIIYMRGLMVK